jgi:predicted RNA-binding Zn-ribbon protein involved in translation (DUF1610 family)
MTKGWCVECGAVYNETPTSFICPKCRKKKASQSAKSRNLSELGHIERRKYKESNPCKERKDGDTE